MNVLQSKENHKTSEKERTMNQKSRKRQNEIERGGTSETKSQENERS